MIERARSQPGRPARIINIASLAGVKAVPMISTYCMSKAAVAHMTRAMAVEWGRYGINVNAICPSYISTELNEHHWETEAGQKLIAMTPRKRLGQADDLDGIVLLLASRMTTGTTARPLARSGLMLSPATSPALKT